MKTRILLFVILLCLTSCKDKLSYTDTECNNLKKGDTIYIKEFYSVGKFIVLKNIPERELVEVYNAEYTWDKNIFTYSNLKE